MNSTSSFLIPIHVLKYIILLSILVTSLAVSAQSAPVCIAGNCQDGMGKAKYSTGIRYDGEFKNGKRHGRGTCYLLNGNKFVGFWENDYPHGKGVMHKADGSLQEGIWVHGKMQIQEKPAETVLVQKDSTSQNQAKDHSCVSGNCVTGTGEYLYENGDRYKGEFLDGLRNGNGLYVYKNGDSYKGAFLNHLYQGQGTLSYADGTSLSGEWNQGAYLGQPLPQKDLTTLDELIRQAQEALHNADEDAERSMKVWAIVVGVTEYPTMPKLQYSDDDAMNVASFLRSPEGGALPDSQLIVLLNGEATYNNIIESISSLFEKADDDDLVIFYFAGHGLEGFFLPADYDGTKNALAHGVVNSLLLDSKAKYKLCLADACHSGSLLNLVASRSTSAEQTVRKYYRAFKDIRRGVSLIMSSKSEEYSLESNGLKQGLFSHFMVRGMRGEADSDQNKIVTITELYNYLQKNVSEFSAGFQNPMMSGNFDPNMPVSVVEE